MTKNNTVFKNISSQKEDLYLSNGEFVLFYNPEHDSNINIQIGENAIVRFYGIIDKGVHNVVVQVVGGNSKLYTGFLLISDNSKIETKVETSIKSSNTVNDINILSLASNGGNIKIDGILDIGEKLEDVVGNLKEENIFLGNSGTIRGIPSLFVKSNNVRASHSCKIEKISDEKLFYLRSRGINKNESTYMMIESMITKTLDGLEEFCDFLQEKLIKNLLLGK